MYYHNLSKSRGSPELWISSLKIGVVEHFCDWICIKKRIPRLGKSSQKEYLKILSGRWAHIDVKYCSDSYVGYA